MSLTPGAPTLCSQLCDQLVGDGETTLIVVGDSKRSYGHRRRHTEILEAERRVVLCRRLLGIGPNPSTKDAELIAFRVGEYNPRRVTLPDIGPPSTEGKETFDFCGLIDRTEVKMESVLACLLLQNRHEQQARHPIRSRPDLELVRGVAHDNPAQGLGPPSTKRDRIVSVDDDLLPNEIHGAHSATSVSQADRPTGTIRRHGVGP